VAFAGANVRVFDIMRQTQAGVGSASKTLQPTGQRVYLNTTSKMPGPIPAKWPVPSDPSARVCVSIRPDPAAVISGSLDGALNAWLRQAPGGPPSLLGLWHEASTMQYPIQAASLRGAQKHIQALAHSNGYNVRVGAIETATISTAKSSTWMARNLDFYSCDIYDGKTCSSNPGSQLDEFKERCDALTDSGQATIGITETNSRCEGRRPFWFTAAWSWFKSHHLDTNNETCFLTFWNPLPARIESGPWLASDRATIDALDAIFHEAAA
jgi:hypothetical protein